MKKTLVVLMLMALAVTTAQLSAQDKKESGDPPASGGSSAPAADESNPDRKPGLDPFRVLIKPEAPPAPMIQPSVSSAPPPPPPPPPLQFSVKAIAGEAPHYVAVLNYNGNDYIAEEGWESEDHAFVVKRIGPNKSGAIEVEVYNKKTNRLAHKAYAEPKIPGYEGPGAEGGAAAPAGDAGAGGGDSSGGAPAPGGDTGMGGSPSGDGGPPLGDAGGASAGGEAGGADSGPPPQ